MHGRPRKAASKEEQESSAVKATKLRALQSQFLQYHHQRNYTKEALEISATLLEANPEYYTAWNYRKLAVESILNQSEAQENPETIKSILDEELRLVETSLKKNYKCYGAWYHRKWVLSKGHSSTDKELWLLGKFQKADTRNFHAWNYRRFVTGLKKIPDEEELRYTEDLINDNFSNYSAWHNRSVLLARLLREKAQGYFPKEDVLTEEYEFVRNALFTDPNDQSGWFYHLWLHDQMVKLDSLLVSSWPSHGSCINLSLDSGASSACPSGKFNTMEFPLILYFSEAVSGVSSSTVTIECEYDVNDVTWIPLSDKTSRFAQAWSAYINFPNEKLRLSKTCQVKVILACSQGIVSSSGVCFSHPADITFMVNVRECNLVHSEGPLERISCREEDFCTADLDSEVLGLMTFHQSRISENDIPRSLEWNVNTIVNEIAHCRELLSLMNCKIGKLMLARLLMAHDALTSYSGTGGFNEGTYKEVLQIYDDLMKLDRPHLQYYKDEYSLVLLKQVTSSMESLVKYCREYRCSTSSTINRSLCLRLNNLSLSRIGCVDKLLWVQILDLSHNELRSIEGLEVMQLLSCLNLSHNKICSFTALEPLRLLRSLKMLDISYNEIGMHSVDTRRYLCSSPLTHTIGDDWNNEQFSDSDVKAADYWEAFSAFRGLNLTQLDIVGNSIVDEKLKVFLSKLLPTLKWLDGEELH